VRTCTIPVVVARDTLETNTPGRLFEFTERRRNCKRK